MTYKAESMAFLIHDLQGNHADMMEKVPRIHRGYFVCGSTQTSIWQQLTDHPLVMKPHSSKDDLQCCIPKASSLHSLVSDRAISTSSLFLLRKKTNKAIKQQAGQFIKLLVIRVIGKEYTLSRVWAVKMNFL